MVRTESRAIAGQAMSQLEVIAIAFGMMILSFRVVPQNSITSFAASRSPGTWTFAEARIEFNIAGATRNRLRFGIILTGMTAGTAVQLALIVPQKTFRYFSVLTRDWMQNRSLVMFVDAGNVYTAYLLCESFSR